MITTLTEEDDRNRGKNGVVFSVGRTVDGRLKLVKDAVLSEKDTAPTNWKFRSFQNHVELDEMFLKRAITAIKNEERLTVPDDVLMDFGRFIFTEVVSQYWSELDGR